MNQPVHILEPLGERAASLPLDLGGEGSALIVPGVEGPALTLQAQGGEWLVEPAADVTARLNGMALHGVQPLADGDVISLGSAQIIVQPGAGRIEVLHLAGNDTVAPLRHEVLPGDEVEAGVREVLASTAPTGSASALAPARRRARTLAWGAAAAVLVGVVGLLLAMVPVPLQLTPEGARVEATGLLDWHGGNRIFLLPGRRTLTISHEGYRDRTLTLDVRRALADATPLALELEYLPGLITVDTGGLDAQLLVDGRVSGKVPGEVEIPAGTHEVILRAPRHVDHVTQLEVKGGGERQQLAAQLQPSVGTLVFDTQPAGASVRIDDQELGFAPQHVELEAGLHQLVLTASGRSAWRSEVAIIAGQTLDLGRIDLARPAPVVAMRSTTPVSAGSLPASGPGGENAAATTAPKVPAAPPPARIESPLIGTLVLLPAGEYLQGSDRREQGRRSNEVQRTVKLTRPFYLAATEVSNEQFRAFRASHKAGLAMGKSLDLDSQAVSNVSWNDAVEFCNWLSLREGLPAAYERRENRWQLVQPVNNGYRLPTEAEWEYAARYVDGKRWQRHAWGDVLPPPQGAVNLAGTEAVPEKPALDAPLASNLPQYRDEHPVVAPVTSYARSPVGLYGMGGNLSEWMHDVYESLPTSAAVTDPMGPANDGPHAVRGANWRTSAIAELRAAWRERGAGASQAIGFRVARYAGETP